MSAPAGSVCLFNTTARSLVTYPCFWVEILLGVMGLAVVLVFFTLCCCAGERTIGVTYHIIVTNAAQMMDDPEERAPPIWAQQLPTNVDEKTTV